MRWLEYGQRLRGRKRGICVERRGRCGPALWEIATVNAAQALGVKAGRLNPGYLADLVALDLSCPALAGWTEESLLDAFIFGAGRDAVAATCVGGSWAVNGGQPTGRR